MNVTSYAYISRLHKVKMDAGIEDETGVEMPGIERCSCPASYTGYSCEASISTHMSHAVVGFS